MAKTVSEIAEYLESLYPLYHCAEWDNSGLIVGDENLSVHKAMVCLDVTQNTAADASASGSQLIISHHPVIFKPLKTLNYGSGKGSLMRTLIESGISVYCMHTNYDSAPGGLNDHLAGCLGLKYTSIVSELKFGRFGKTDRNYSMSDFIKWVKKSLAVENVRFSGDEKKEVNTAAVFCGAFDEESIVSLAEKPDVIVTGDLKYHTALELSESGYNIIDAGHFYTEHIMVSDIAQKLRVEFPDIEVIESERDKDVFTYY